MNQQEARDHHEQVAHQAFVLSVLRVLPGSGVTKAWFEKECPGSRLAPVIDVLRNSWGLTIDGRGTITEPHVMPDVEQKPQLIRTIGDFKVAYWQSDHWMAVSNKRRKYDNHRCVLCGTETDLRVHHICYYLFDERLDELMTLCDPHHLVIHRGRRNDDESKNGFKSVTFPSGVPLEFYQKLNVDPNIPEWVYPVP